jgi:hypothetical protein
MWLCTYTFCTCVLIENICMSEFVTVLCIWSIFVYVTVSCFCKLCKYMLICCAYCRYTYAQICMYTYICVSICAYVCMYICMYVYTDTCTQTYICAHNQHIHVYLITIRPALQVRYIHTCIYIYIYIYIYKCIHVTSSHSDLAFKLVSPLHCQKKKDVIFMYSQRHQMYIHVQTDRQRHALGLRTYFNSEPTLTQNLL